MIAADAPPGLRLLDEFRETLTTTSRQNMVVAWTAFQTADNLDSLAAVWATHRTEMNRVFNVIRLLPSCTQRTSQLIRTLDTIVEEAQRTEAQEQISELEESLTQVSDLTSTLEVPASVVDPDVMARLRTPAGYEVNPEGVFKTRVGEDGVIRYSKIASAPIFLAGRTSDVLSGEARRQVVWRGANGWTSRIVERRTIMDSRRLIALADWEAPVNSMSTPLLIPFLTDFEAENAHRLAAVRSVNRMGWLPDGSFILADQHHSPNHEEDPYTLSAPPGLETVATGWTCEGTWEEWLEAVELAKEFPLMMIAIYASAAAPLLEMLKVSGFVIDFSGETSGGKTTALRMAASVWGRPAESYPTAMYSWDSTKVWIERTCGFLCNLPVILDETKRAKHPSTVRDVIYDFCQGQGRGRGAPDGTRHTATWRSVLISSGEGAATSFSQDAGTRARVISIEGKPLGNNAAVGGRVSEDIQLVLSMNWGHLGRKIIKYLIAHRVHWPVFRQRFQETRERYINAARGAVARRHATYIAVLDLTARILEQIGLPQPTFDPFEFLVETMNRASTEADRPLVALEEVIGWCVANQHRFFGRGAYNASGGIQVPSQGWVGTWSEHEDWSVLAITGIELRRILHQQGFNATEITSRWYERNWLDSNGGRNRTKVVRLDKSQIRCYCIKREAAEMVMSES